MIRNKWKKLINEYLFQELFLIETSAFVSSVAVYLYNITSCIFIMFLGHRFIHL